MSDRMTLIPFDRLMLWILKEKNEQGTVFGVHHAFKADPDKTLPIFTEKIETPFGPAAGPNTQLAQNIVASYYAGSRFFELKTVQILDGEDLPVNKPCILADDECYNCEWSTELRVLDAFEEYVKAWFALKVISKEFGLGGMDGFVFNMSVGYDLEGIRSPKVDRFIEGLKDASQTEIFQSCKAWLLEHLDLFAHVTADDVNAITPHICTSITLSTLHGCPPQEIERIAAYLMNEKKLNTYIKCNPTLLGYEFARKRMDAMGYDYVAFGDFHFKDDLQYEDAIPMMRRLLELAGSHGLEFGVKITNTFPVDVTRNELPSEEMYMSGRSLYPLSIALAAKLSEEFEGGLRISYSGGADFNNIDRIFNAGIWPITMATTVLKPGGYNRFDQIGALLLKQPYKKFDGVDAAQVRKLSDDAVTDPHHTKSIKPLPSRKMKQEVPLIDCFVAPCKDGCPIHQDITAYVELAGQGRYEEALEVIIQKNPLPFMTGTICAHNCMSKCTRNFYDEAVNIRGVKLEAAQKGFDALMANLKDNAGNETIAGMKAAVVGGGPAGLAAAYFLGKAGIDVTVFEKKDSLGGIVRHVIPSFRISDAAIENDIALVKAMGAKIQLNTEVKSLDALKAMGYTHVVLAVGAGKPGTLTLKNGYAQNALEVMEALKKTPKTVDLGKNVVIIGGGNSAMDAARAAKRANGVEHVYLVYRRSRRYMPADEEELVYALNDGVEFKELLAPISLENGELICEQMKLGAMDTSGRCRPEPTGVMVRVPADTVLAAVGERIDSDFYTAAGIQVNESGRAVINEFTMETSIENVYVAGDGVYGPATVVEAIRDARKAVNGILEKAGIGQVTDFTAEAGVSESTLYNKKGHILGEAEADHESQRCLTCSVVCENCIDVCPNRANVSIKVPGKAMAQVVHVDWMCNECGNCKSFCPYSSAPYKDKFTVFACEKDFEDSTNQGFVVVSEEPLTVRVRLGASVKDFRIYDKDCSLYPDLRDLIRTVYEDYSYLLLNQDR